MVKEFYYAVNTLNNSVRKVELRETKSYLIDDKTGCKYKKVNTSGQGILASNVTFENYRFRGSEIYSLDDPIPLKLTRENSEKAFIKEVKQKLIERANEIDNLEQAADLNDLLHLGVVHKRDLEK